MLEGLDCNVLVRWFIFGLVWFGQIWEGIDGLSARMERMSVSSSCSSGSGESS